MQKQHPQENGRDDSARRGGESGMVLVAALLVMAMLSLLGIAGLATSTLEVKIAGHDRDAKQAFFLAEAGLLRAQYEMVKGWGRGSGGTGAGGDFTFTWADPPTAVGGWDTDKWVNFTLVDGRGVRCLIREHEAGAPYKITRCEGLLQPALDTRASLYFRHSGAPLVSGIGVAGTDTMMMAGAGWASDIWGGYVLRDSADALFGIAGNDAETLDLTGTPADGSFQIVGTLSEANTFTFFANPLLGEPGGPNPEWPDKGFDFDGWYLRHDAGTLSKITNTAYTANAMVLTIGGTPATGWFEVVANPWLVANAGATLRFESGPGKDFVVPSGIATYGSADVTAEEVTPGRYRVTAVSAETTAGNTKGIRIDARLEAGGTVSLTNWRQIQ